MSRFGLPRLHPWFGLAHKRHGGAMAALAGLSCALAQPPFGLLPGLLGYAVLFALLDGASGERPMRSAFWRGWLAGVAYFLIAIWWVSEAFMVDVAEHGWQAPFAVAGLAASLGLFWGAAGLIYRMLAAKLILQRSPWRLTIFAALFGLAEWLRGHVLTGFPWDLPGETWRAGDAISQMASLVGVYGLSVLTLFVAASPAAMDRAATGARRWLAPMLGAGVLIGMQGYGMARLGAPDAQTGAQARADGRTVRVVQANVAQAAKWDAAAFTDIVQRYTRLTAQPPRGRAADIVIWSETAIPALVEDYMAPGTWTRAAVIGALTPGQVLLFGADRTDGANYYNSLLILQRDGEDFRLLGRYDKHHLVPFGEYFPMDSLASWTGLKALVHVGDGFTPGPAARVLSASPVPPLVPMICYEGLFPGAVADHGQRAEWIVNVSNDAWFGRTSGPLQHYNMARYRSIEEGLPMARATPTGVSAVVDAYGRPRAELGAGAFGVIDQVIPRALPPTFFHIWGDLVFWMLIFAGLTPLILSRIVAAPRPGASVASYLRLHKMADDARQGGYD